MGINKIVNLIQQGSLQEAFKEIEDQLTGSFNLSESVSRQDYIALKKLRRSVKSFLSKSKKSKRGKGQIPVIRVIGRLIPPSINYPWLIGQESQLSASSPFNVQEDPIIKKREAALIQIANTQHQPFKEDLAALAYAIDEEDIPILFFGEVGAGKTFLAKEIHKISKRKNLKFVTVNCAGINETNIFANLFGAEKGSFTGSIGELKGMIREAEGGTLFIDEIDKAPKEIRYHLMTFIDTKEFYPLGRSTPRKANVRLIVGTNRDLKLLVQKGEFEEDLFSRIIGRMVYVPPLRQRSEDIPLFINTIINEYNGKNKIPVAIEKEALAYLINYSWPQNVRQLNYYLLLRFGDCKRVGTNVLTLDLIKQKPPETIAVNSSNDFSGFEEMMKIYLQKWETENGKYLSDFVEPVVAKIYLEDYGPHLNQSKKYEEASKILGMSGERRADSTLYKQYLKYEEIKKKFS